MNFIDGLKNFLLFINENWTSVLVIFGLILMLWKKIENYKKLSTEEKIAIAKRQIQERILKLISDAEENYEDWAKAGEIKRAEVIARIYDEYPILSSVVNQDELINWIDEQIDAALLTLRDLWEKKEAV